MDLAEWESGENLEWTGGGEIIIRIYFMDIIFKWNGKAQNLKTIK